MITEQELFDAAVTVMRKQGWERSMNNANGCCRYRGDGGLRCAVGAVMPDSLYTPNMEGDGVTELYDCGYLAGWDGAEHLGLLSAMQCAHDEHPAFNATSSMEDRFRNIAKNFGLVFVEAANG